MKKLQVIKVDGINYTLKNETTYEIPFIFYGEKKPKINDIIYVSNKILNETNIYNFGPITKENINENEIMKVVNDTEEYYLQQYYG